MSAQLLLHVARIPPPFRNLLWKNRFCREPCTLTPAIFDHCFHKPQPLDFQSPDFFGYRPSSDKLRPKRLMSSIVPATLLIRRESLRLVQAPLWPFEFRQG